MLAKGSEAFRPNAARPHFVFFACIAILLPIHPSLQYILKSNEIPSEIVAFMLFFPALYSLLTQTVFNRRVIFVIALFLIYICWIVVRGLFSPALGEMHFYASIRSVAILVPFAMLCALIGAQAHRWASRTIFFMGLFAVLHLWFLILFGGEVGQAGGFRSLSLNTEWANYQSTSFYIGIAGAFMASTALTRNGMFRWIGVAGVILALATMGMVGARAPVVAVLVSAFIVWLIRVPGRLLRRSVLVILMSVAIFAALLLRFDGLVGEFLVVQRFLVLFEDGDSSQRIRLFSSAIAMWLESPVNFLFGGGIGEFPKYIGEPPEEGWHPHNFILESLAEAGLIAGLMLFAIGVLLMNRLFNIRSRRADLDDVYLGVLALYALVAFQFMGGVQTIWIPTFFVALFLFVKSHGRA